VPEEDWREPDVASSLADLDELRKIMPRLSLEEVLSARHEAHKY